MRSANALLELPQAPATVPAGTLVPALIIADLAGGFTLLSRYLYNLFKSLEMLPSIQYS